MPEIKKQEEYAQKLAARQYELDAPRREALAKQAAEAAKIERERQVKYDECLTQQAYNLTDYKTAIENCKGLE